MEIKNANLMQFQFNENKIARKTLIT